MSADIHTGLAFDGDSDLPMILSYVDGLPTGYVLSKVLRVQVGGKDERMITTEFDQVSIPQELIFATSEELFDFIASALANFAQNEVEIFTYLLEGKGKLGYGTVDANKCDLNVEIWYKPSPSCGSVLGSMLPDYVQSSDVALDSKDSDIIEGSSRISLECPISALISITMWTKTLEDQPSAALIVLKEVAEDVSDVIIFVDGSCKVMLENDNDVDDLHDKILNCEKDGSEQPESAKGVPILLDLTQDDNRVDAMESIEIEDRKPHVANLQIDHGFGTSAARIDAQVIGRSEPSNFTISPVYSDATSPTPIQAEARGNANLTTLGIQNQVSAASNL
ncbi:hypothetical protein DITRI_Ditri16bG0139500 [Diplodiscus trichospermus]